MMRHERHKSVGMFSLPLAKRDSAKALPVLRTPEEEKGAVE